MADKVFTGTVKWFNNRKGFGFIVSDETESDVMLHHSAIVMDGFKTAKEGDTVQFEIDENRKPKLAAKNAHIQRAGTA